MSFRGPNNFRPSFHSLVHIASIMGGTDGVARGKKAHREQPDRRDGVALAGLRPLVRLRGQAVGQEGPEQREDRRLLSWCVGSGHY